jgi:predicted CXXCH cytochrome family protein
VKYLHKRGCFLITFLLLLPIINVSVVWASIDEECLRCHSNKKIVGEPHLIDAGKYASTAHANIAGTNFGCRTCHDKISSQHPNDGPVTFTTKCVDCHGEIKDEYAKSAHVKNASCGDCHNPHTAQGATELSSADMNRMCSRCHKIDKMVSLHAEWLPQAKLHMQNLPCVTCHTGSKNYVITMYIIKRQEDSRYSDFKLANFDELKKLSGEKDIRSLLDANNDNYISLSELKLFNTNKTHDYLRLQGTMTPEIVTHNFQVLANRWDCTFCHASGPEARQTSFIALPMENGTYQRVAIEQGAVLDALYGTPDFYMMGSTRNALMDKIGLAIIIGGLIMPIGHGSLRFLTRKNRNGKGH